AQRDGIGVAITAAGLNDGGNSGGGGGGGAVVERKKRIGGQRRAARVFTGLFNREFNAGDAIHLSGANANETAVFGNGNRVAFDVLDAFPREQQIVDFAFFGRALRHGF